MFSEAGRYRENQQRQAWTVVLTSRGVPSIYYGSEIYLRDDPQLAGALFTSSRSIMKFHRNNSSSSFRHLKKLIQIRRELGLYRNEQKYISDVSHPDRFATVTHTDDERLVVILHNFSPHYKRVEQFSLKPFTKKSGLRFKDLLLPRFKVAAKDRVLSFSLGAYQSRILVEQHNT